MQGIDRAAVLGGLGGLSANQILAALAATVVAFVAVAGQERAVVAHLGLRLPRRQAGYAAAAAAAVSQTVGFGPLIGAMVRRRLLPGLTMRQSFTVSAGIAAGFFAGLGMFSLASLAMTPGLPYRGLASAALGTAAMATLGMCLVRRRTIMGLRLPNILVTARFLFWLAIDLAALALALWLVLPAENAPELRALLPVFLIGLGLGMASGSPGGVGPLEAALLTKLPGTDEAGLVAAIVAFRALSFAVPAVCGGIWLVVGGRRAVWPGREATETSRLSDEALHDLPNAEAQLIRQGELSLISGPTGWTWLGGKLAHTRVVIGALMVPDTWPLVPRDEGIVFDGRKNGPVAQRLAARGQVILKALAGGQAGRRWDRALLPKARADLPKMRLSGLFRVVARQEKAAGKSAPGAASAGGAVARRKSAQGAALDAVARLAQSEARLLCLYKVDGRVAALARARGFAVLPVAREAVLDPQSFHLVVPERARLRRKLSQARKAGVVVEDCAKPPLAEMEEVARAWQVAHGRERGFSMGRWDRSYAAGQRVFSARQADGKLVAFVTFHVSRTNWVLDLVRVLPCAPDGTIHAMILHAIDMARWLEVREFSLAAVPETRFGLRGILARLAGRATRGAAGLAQFKGAFAPRWRTLYFAAPSRLTLVLAGMDIARAILRPSPLIVGREILPAAGSVEYAGNRTAKEEGQAA
jgi:uncharacterized membrane protein YbhN (UPF0104 family)